MPVSIIVLIPDFLLRVPLPDDLWLLVLVLAPLTDLWVSLVGLDEVQAFFLGVEDLLVLSIDLLLGLAVVLRVVVVLNGRFVSGLLLLLLWVGWDSLWVGSWDSLWVGSSGFLWLGAWKSRSLLWLGAWKRALIQLEKVEVVWVNVKNILAKVTHLVDLSGFHVGIDMHSLGETQESSDDLELHC